MYSPNPATLSFYHRACRSGLPTDVRLGSPRLRDCGGLGICSIRLRGQNTSAAACSHVVPTFLRIEAATGRLLLHLTGRALTPEVRERHFRGGFLTLTHPYRLSPPLLRALGLPAGKYTLPTGRYPILDDGTFCTASLPLACVIRGIQPLPRPAA
ncbi:hypothetical protein GGR26_000468 [Lewinella marina]|uniref:Uncharacterized protein n=1 Tax=Neolewinella marina TaxID=438751 RepID=A0A2G0CJG3_9BACT|nr:hypothetical protein [Neolewinella marina]NJB84723.1 hypothetical protein [Neolewinella marina]PHL00117.1 hypothetical protein CGL56_03485 [Neolewinella marina]